MRMVICLHSQNILNRWKNYLSQLLNVPRFSVVRLLAPDPTPSEVQIAIAKLKRYKSPGSDQILAEVIQAGDKIQSQIHKLLNSILNKEELPDQWKGSIIVPIHNKGDKTNYSNYHAINFIQNLLDVPSRLSPHIDEVTGDHQCGFRHKLLIRFSAFVRYWRKNGSTMISSSQTSRKPVIELGGK
jgi:hypothetical protein